MTEDGDSGKGKGAKGRDGAEPPASGKVLAAAGPSIAGHPRAARSVARAKAWAALAGFCLGGYLSLSSGTLAEALFRALAAGVVCYLAVWAGAVFVWRRLVVLELHAREHQLRAAPRALPAGDERAEAGELRGAV